MSRTGLVTDSIPNFAPTSNVGPTRENQMRSPNQSHRRPHFYLPSLQLPQGSPEPSQFSARKLPTLPTAYESLPNTSECGQLPLL